MLLKVTLEAVCGRTHIKVTRVSVVAVFALDGAIVAQDALLVAALAEPTGVALAHP